MEIDQCHEQLNTILKGDGSAIGLTEDDDKLRRWTICGPEIARMVREYEDASVITKKRQGFRNDSRIIMEVI